MGDPECYVNKSAESVVTCFVCKELTLKEFEGSKGHIYQTVKTVQQKLSRFYQFRERTVFSNSPIFMLNVVCSEFCSESAVTCFVCKELTLKEFEDIVGDPECYVNSSAESVVTCFVSKELTLKEFEGVVGDPEGYVNSSAESVVTCFVCKELTLKEFEGSKGQIYQTVKTVQQKLSRFYQFREWTVFSKSPIFMLNVVYSEYCSESVVTCFVCKELTLNEF